MTARDQHITKLKKSENWIAYLEEHSGLPGKRGNLELMKIIMEIGNETFFNECLKVDDSVSPTNTPGEFVAMCGTAGLGTLVCNGKTEYWQTLKIQSSDPRWRVREGVAFALQKIGEHDFTSLIKNLENWKTGNPFEKRAVVAGLCEPVLLKKSDHAEIVLTMIIEIILFVKNIEDRRSEDFRVLRKGLEYGFSVAIAGSPEKGKKAFEMLISESDKDIQWILKENLKKNRLMRMDKEWTEKMKNILG